MKQKALKIKNKTLFIYKSVKTTNTMFMRETGDPTTETITTLTTTTGFNK